MRFNLNKLARIIMPWFFMNPDGSTDDTINSDYVNVHVTALNPVNEDLKTYQDEVIENIGYSFQVTSLENELNDRFDPVLRQIYISTNISSTTNYVFSKDEVIGSSLKKFVHSESEAITEPLKMYIFSEDENITSGTNYIVHVPTLINDVYNLLIINTIERVNAFTITYEIQTF